MDEEEGIIILSTMLRREIASHKLALAAIDSLANLILTELVYGEDDYNELLSILDTVEMKINSNRDGICLK